MDLTIANQGGGNNNNSNIVVRDYRKGNWTLQETMVLIEAKKMDDERRMKRHVGDQGTAKPAELRWKWVEDYCWKNGCLRSQNQCNDKWDNLMRDFKKVREYQRRVLQAEEDINNNHKSYWRIEKNERKDKNLPSNMLPQIYDALVEVVEKKGGQRVLVTVAAGSSNPSVEKTTTTYGSTLGQQYSMPPPMQQFPIIQPPAMMLPLPPAQPEPEPEPPIFPSSQPLPTVDSDTSEYSDSPAKRRKRRGGGDGGGEGTSGGGGASQDQVGSAISRSASIIAEAIQSCEEREERRHREVLRLHERRLQIEESKAEINRQGVNGLVDAINKLASSILALAANKNQSTSK